MAKFENCYLEFLVSEKEKFSQDWSEANWSQFHSLKGAVEIKKKYSFGCLLSMDISKYFVFENVYELVLKHKSTQSTYLSN